MNKFEEAISKIKDVITSKETENKEIINKIDSTLKEQQEITQEIEDISLEINKIKNAKYDKKELIQECIGIGIFGGIVFSTIYFVVLLIAFLSNHVNNFFDSIKAILFCFPLMSITMGISMRIDYRKKFKEVKERIIESEKNLSIAQIKKEELERKLNENKINEDILRNDYFLSNQKIEELDDLLSYVEDMEADTFYNIFESMSNQYEKMINEKFDKDINIAAKLSQQSLARILNRENNDLNK